MWLQKVLKSGIKFLFSKKIIAGVPAIIKNSGGEILLGKRDKNMLYYPNIWGLPGGMIEFGETVEQTIKRELKEEIGVDSEFIKYGKPHMGLPTRECPIQNLSIPVFCRLKETPKPKDETSEVKWFKPKEIKEMKLAYDHKDILKQEGII